MAHRGDPAFDVAFLLCHLTLKAIHLPEHASRLDQVLLSLVEGLRVVTLALLPYIPEAADTLLNALGEDERGLAEFGSRGGGARIERIDPLFPKMEAG